jgi:predicted alpha/beta-hydrolase family hydrolase
MTWPVGVMRWRVAVDEEETTAVFEPGAPLGGRAVFVCAHGVGGHLEDRGMVRLAAVLRARGFALVRFNFLYREKGSDRPDPMPRLKRCLGAVVARTRKELGPRSLIIGGRSMGGRAASMLAADGMACDALLLLAYPLHPAGKPEQLRDAHLPQIKAPVLCFNGTRDVLCRRDLMENVLATVRSPWEMHWLEGADHSFRLGKSSGRTDAEVLDEVGDVSQRWLSRLAGR